MLTICENISGEKYKEFLHIAIDSSDAFSIMIRYPKSPETLFGFNKGFYKEAIDYIKTMKQWRAAMQANLLKSRHDSQWASGISYDPNYAFTIDYYKFNTDTLPFVMQPQSLFGWNGPLFPEDICFFKKGYCWMTTTTHETFASVSNSSPKAIAWLKGHLQCIIEEGEEGIIPYYEDYGL